MAKIQGTFSISREQSRACTSSAEARKGARKGTIVVDKERCKGCGVCVASCPFGVLELSVEVNSKGYPVARMANPDACTGCASCAVICPDSVIAVYRQKFE